MVTPRTFLFVLLGSVGCLLVIHVILSRWETVRRIDMYPDGRTSRLPSYSRGDHQRALDHSRNETSPPPQPFPEQATLRKPVVYSGPLRDPSVWARYDPLQALPVANESSVVRILVITYFRSGSTFLGEMLQQNWRTFYHFEPLHYMSEDDRVARGRVPEALALLGSLFRCNFSSAASYVDWAVAEQHQFLFRRNRFLWATCRLHPASCFSPAFLSAACRRASVHVMKVTRLDLQHVRRFLLDNKDLRVQLVHLVRDPRAVICSRKALDWCNGSACSDPAVLCDQMSRDLGEALRIQEDGLSTVVRLRHEDVSTRPEREARQLYRRLGLPYGPAVVRFLESHTRGSGADGLDPYSTRRNSSSVPFEWRRKLSYENIVHVQDSCLAVMQLLDYAVVRGPGDLLSSA